MSSSSLSCELNIFNRDENIDGRNFQSNNCWSQMKVPFNNSWRCMISRCRIIACRLFKEWYIRKSLGRVASSHCHYCIINPYLVHCSLCYLGYLGSVREQVVINLLNFYMQALQHHHYTLCFMFVSFRVLIFRFTHLNRLHGYILLYRFWVCFTDSTSDRSTYPMGVDRVTNTPPANCSISSLL
jgi:hypothetical protein